MDLSNTTKTLVANANSVAKTCASTERQCLIFMIFGETWKNFEAHFMFNYDETVCTNVQNVPKVLAPKSMKQVGQTVATERGILVTDGCCVSASDRSLPPA